MGGGDVPLAPEVALFEVRAGYRVTLAADAVANARFMEFDDAGRLYVSRPALGDVVVLSDADGDGYYEGRATFVAEMNSIHGLDWHDGWMWMTRSDTVLRARDTTGDGIADEVVTVLGPDELPGGGWHWWRSILVTDEGFFTGIGDSGNITDEQTTDRQKVFRYNLDGSGKTLFASGLRNTEKLRVRARTGAIYGCDHGSDAYGRPLGEVDPSNQPITDMNPADEFNRIVEGGFYGHPFLTGRRVPRLDYLGHPELVGYAGRTIVPELDFPAHWAPNGFCFIEGKRIEGKRIEGKESEGGVGMPSSHVGDAFVAFHGSWNSTRKVGYQVARVMFDDDPVLAPEGRATGMVTIVRTMRPSPTAEEPWAMEILARPVDCVEAPDGTVLFSCDANGRVYRIVRVGD
jgi:glucose/arabinose dehydrogenase